MSTTYEKGHAKNVANFQNMIEFVTDYGTMYNPSNKSLEIPTLESLRTEASSALLDVITKNTLFNNTVNSRMAKFSGLRQLSTRLMNTTLRNKKSYNRNRNTTLRNKKSCNRNENMSLRNVLSLFIQTRFLSVAEVKTKTSQIT